MLNLINKIEATDYKEYEFSDSGQMIVK